MMQQRPGTAVDNSGEKGTPSVDRKIGLSVFLNTHRLSDGKTTRSPPHCVHKVKITLGQFDGLSLAKLPITFTWTSNHLHLSISGSRLNIFRVELFKSGLSVPPVVVPQLPVMLPLSATRRQVYYLPPGGSAVRGMVLMGGYGGYCQVQLKACSTKATRLGMGDNGSQKVLPYPCPSVGFYIDTQDFGGWGAAREKIVVDSEERFRDGKLVRKMEFFNSEEDIDLEGICANCGGILNFS